MVTHLTRMETDQKTDNHKIASCTSRVSKSKKCEHWIKSLHKICKCAICLESPQNPVRIKECNHIFCKQCILSYINKETHENTCPLCRHNFYTSRIFRDRHLDDILKQISEISNTNQDDDCDDAIHDMDNDECECDNKSCAENETTNKEPSNNCDFLNLDVVVQNHSAFVRYCSRRDEVCKRKWKRYCSRMNPRRGNGYSTGWV